jgi:hypothetical protein
VSSLRFINRGVVARGGALERDIEETIADLEGKLHDKLRSIGAEKLPFHEEAPEFFWPPFIERAQVN